MNERLISLKSSALKHGISPKDIECAVADCRYDEIVDGDEEKWLLLGFDKKGRLLEIIYNEIDDQTIRVFHANICRTSYEKLLQK
jgi:uncharacterized DUF497 family protein